MRTYTDKRGLFLCQGGTKTQSLRVSPSTGWLMGTTSSGPVIHLLPIFSARIVKYCASTAQQESLLLLRVGYISHILPYFASFPGYIFSINWKKGDPHPLRQAPTPRGRGVSATADTPPTKMVCQSLLGRCKVLPHSKKTTTVQRWKKLSLINLQNLNNIKEPTCIHLATKVFPLY